MCVKSDRRPRAQLCAAERSHQLYLAKEFLALLRNEKHLNCPTVKKQKQRTHNCVAAGGWFFYFAFQIHASILAVFYCKRFLDLLAHKTEHNEEDPAGGSLVRAAAIMPVV